MSLKRSHGSTRTASGGPEPGTKIGRQELFDSLKKLVNREQPFTAVDIALSTGAGEAQVSKALHGLTAEGYLEKVDVGQYRVAPAFEEVTIAEFTKAFGRASKMDSTRQRDLSEIQRLKQNNDIMRGKLLGAIADRDHYLAVLREHQIDPGPPPSASSPPAPGSNGA